MCTPLETDPSWLLVEDPSKDDAFTKDCDRLNEVLYIKHISIYSIFKSEFDALYANNEVSGSEQRTRRDCLVEKISKDFNAYLTARLGQKRSHLIPIIRDLFSQVALIGVTTPFIRYYSDHFNGALIAKADATEQRCTLLDPLNPKDDSVRIVATVETTYDQIVDHSKEVGRVDIQPIKLNGFALYIINSNGTVEEHIGSMPTHPLPVIRLHKEAAEAEP